MPIKYPFSVDSIVQLFVQHRNWVSSALLVLAKSKLPTGAFSGLGEKDVALVTGGLGGLGLAIVSTLLDKYGLLRVYILDVVEPKIDLGDRVQYIRCDLSASSDVDSAIERVLDECHTKGSPLSVLVNNAGIRMSGPLLSMKPLAIQKVFDINTFAAVRILQQVISQHIEKHCSRRLSVVTVSSVLGAFGARHVLAYSASKAAATQFHEVLAQELKHHDSIRMLLVTPGQLTTEMFQDLEPSRPFVAPLVDHTALARAMLEKVNTGEIGIMCEPFYSHFGYLMKVLPWSMQLLARRFTKMDDSIKSQENI